MRRRLLCFSAPRFWPPGRWWERRQSGSRHRRHRSRSCFWATRIPPATAPTTTTAPTSASARPTTGPSSTSPPSARRATRSRSSTGPAAAAVTDHIFGPRFDDGLFKRSDRLPGNWSVDSPGLVELLELRGQACETDYPDEETMVLEVTRASFDPSSARRSSSSSATGRWSRRPTSSARTPTSSSSRPGATTPASWADIVRRCFGV